MRWGGVYFFIAILILFLLPVYAHVPIIAEDNDNLENAVFIEDPAKSWAVYDELHAGGVVHYYRFQMQPGQVLRLSLFIPRPDTFVPSLAIIGPGVSSNDTSPAFLEIPGDSGFLIVEGRMPDRATYEPFTPTNLYNIAEIELDIEKEGTYYAGVYDRASGGPYGIAIGSREEFTLDEWIMVPINVVRLHRWEGQSLVFIIAPLIAVLIGGLLFIRSRQLSMSTAGWVGSTAGLLYIGSGAMVFVQMVIALTSASFTSAAIITLVLALLPVAAGYAVIYTALRGINLRTRVTMLTLGILGFFIWAGLIAGPVLTILSGLLPSPNK